MHGRQLHQLTNKPEVLNVVDLTTQRLPVLCCCSRACLGAHNFPDRVLWPPRLTLSVLKTASS